MQQKPLVFVIYDSSTNSVFASQVVQPLLAYLEHDNARTAILVSYERQTLTSEQLKTLKSLHSRLRIIIIKQLPFMGICSIYYGAYQLRKHLALDECLRIIARGPLAGAVCLYGRKKNHIPITIQVRGLLAAEYQYAHAASGSLLIRWWHHLRVWQYARLERLVYASSNEHTNLEAVSSALKDYILDTYHAPASAVIVAHHDIPKPLDARMRIQWRHEIRQQLMIKPTTHVYCYSGSVKAWQCPEKVITFFKHQIHNNPDSFLLIITQNCSAFKVLIDNAQLSPHSYTVITVPHAQVCQYLAACDSGIIFREQTLINWISRPTKVLEYHAAGLEVVHNNTVAWIAQSLPAQSQKIVDLDCPTYF